MGFAAAKAKIKEVLEGIKVANILDNPSGEISTAGIALAGLSVSVSTGQAKVGSQAFRVVGGAGGTDHFFIELGGSGFTISPDTFYTFSVHYKPDPANGTEPTFKLGFEWQTALGAIISEEYGSNITPIADADWARISISLKSPSNGGRLRPIVKEVSGWSASEIVWLDGLMLNEGGLEDYIDGSMPGCKWDGAANASASKRQIKRVYENPPNGLQDLPCFVMYPAGLNPERRPSGWRVDRYSLVVRLAAHDSDWDRAGAICEAYRDLVVSAFDGNIQLGGKADVIQGPEASAGVQFPYGDRMYLGMDFTFNIRIGNGRAGGFVS